MDSPFSFDADDLSLDFLNTSGRVGEAPSELLSSPARVLDWMREARLASPEDERALRACPPDARILLGEAVRLRDSIHAIASALASETLVPEHAVLALNRVLALEGERRHVVDREGGFEIAFVRERRGPVGLLIPVARSAADLLVSADPSRVRTCASCGLWFRDVSRNGRRRWCSMARCGNRAKVAAHYRRQSA